MKIFDTLTQKLKTLNKIKINIYLCGPTIYDNLHIGNARPIILIDILIRFIEFQGTKVIFLQNVTDIDDKIITKAVLEKTTEKKITNKYLNAFMINLQELNIRMPNAIIPVSTKIKEIDTFIKLLVDNKSAYEIDGNVYFDINKYQKLYGQLANKNIKDLVIGSRIDYDTNKKNIFDFLIWKKTTKGLQWKYSFGAGRPGWHTECTAIIADYFNDSSIDIHAGGIDLQFPHHENERIQYYAKNKSEIANIWMHIGHLTIFNKKMSKSIGNITTINNFVNQYGADILRYIFLTTYYKQPINISESLIEQAKKFFLKIFNLNKKIKQAIIINNWKKTIDFNIEILEEFKDYIKNDLNTPCVLTLLERIIKNINKTLIILNKDILIQVNTINLILKVLGIQTQIDQTLSVNDYKIYMSWKTALDSQDYLTADKLRTKLIENGIL